MTDPTSSSFAGARQEPPLRPRLVFAGTRPGERVQLRLAAGRLGVFLTIAGQGGIVLEPATFQRLCQAGLRIVAGLQGGHA